MTTYKTVSVETTVDVDIGLDEFDDADLIEEIEERGYVIINQKDVIEPLDRNDIEILINFIGSQTIGSDLWNISDKLYIINR